MAVRKMDELGICLGMQLLFEASKEGPGPGPGLGYVPGKLVRFRDALDGKGQTLRVPHMGWNALGLAAPEDPIVSRLEPYSRSYFVRGFHADGVPPENTVLTAT